MYEYAGSPGLTAWLTLPHVRYPITATGLFKIFYLYRHLHGDIGTVPYYVEHHFLLTKGGGVKYNNSCIMRYSCLLLDGSGSIEIMTDPDP
jgi:hypothetical protein